LLYRVRILKTSVHIQIGDIMTATYANSLGGAFGFDDDPYVNPPYINAMRAPTSQDIQLPGTRWQDSSVNPPIVYATTGGGNWDTGGVEPATTTTYGTVILTDNNEPVATKFYVDAIAIAGAPVATETTAGIGELATDAEAIAGTPSTGLLALFVTPSNLAPVFASPPSLGGTVPADGTFTWIAANATGTGNILTSDTASGFGVTGAGVDVTIDSAAGRVVINGEEAAADAIRLVSAAGGIDADAALQINIATSQNAADAIVVNASAGGIDITAAGAAGEDIDITNTAGSIRLVAGESAADSIVLSSTIGGIDILANGAAAGEDIDISTSASVNITATENNAGAIIVRANGGTSERVTLLASQGTGVDSINLESTAGGITLSAALASADAINLSASAGGVDIDGALQVNIASSQNAVDAVRIIASAGGIDIDAVGAATKDINITNTGGSVVIVATESVADAIRMNASGAAGGFDIDAGTNGFIVDTTGAISLDAAAASNFTVTGAFDISMITTAGSANITAGEDAADAIVLSAGAGGIDILATGAAGQDIDIVNTGGSVNISATENDAGAITIGTNGGTSERITVTAAQGTNAASIGLTSTAGGITLTGGLATGDAINIVASNAAGGIDVDAGTGGVIIDTTGAISLDSATASNFTVTGAADLTVNSTAGSLILRAGESAVDAVVLESTAGGVQILASGAAAGEDILITATGSSIGITATENVTDAIVINASGAASRVRVAAGTGSIHLNSGLVVKATSVNNAASPYTVLGTDYFIYVDSSGGAVTVTLPAATALAGRTFVIRDAAGSAAVNNITIGGGGTNLVGGGAAAATKVLSAAYSGATVYSNGTTWNYVYVA
jgi:fibronectin-binding autotransporter adhesin